MAIDTDNDPETIFINDNLEKFEKIKNEESKYYFHKGMNDELLEYWNLNCYNFHNKNLKEIVCRYCLTVRVYCLLKKAERVNHCRQCKACVRKYDHHCLFINNCIGFSNYKLFMNLVFYANVCCIYIIITMIDGLKFWLNQKGVLTGLLLDEHQLHFILRQSIIIKYYRRANILLLNLSF